MTYKIFKKIICASVFLLISCSSKEETSNVVDVRSNDVIIVRNEPTKTNKPTKIKETTKLANLEKIEAKVNDLQKWLNQNENSYIKRKKSKQKQERKEMLANFDKDAWKDLPDDKSKKEWAADVFGRVSNINALEALYYLEVSDDPLIAASAKRLLGIFYARSKKFDKALSQMKQAENEIKNINNEYKDLTKTEAKSLISLYVSAGTVAEMSGNLDLQLAYRKKTIEAGEATGLNHPFHDIYYVWALCLAKKNEEAIEQIELTLKKNPDPWPRQELESMLDKLKKGEPAGSSCTF